MATWNRTDICEAYLVLEWDYNVNGWLRERPSNQRRMESIGVQLHRMGVQIRRSLGDFASLSENGKEIYLNAEKRLWLPSH